MVLREPDVAGNLWLVGISTKFTPPAGRLKIELPWMEGGHPETGLHRRCALVCKWVVPWNASKILRCVGVLPSSIAEKAVEYAITAAEEKKAMLDANETPRSGP
jgi:hypothetical protein